GSAPGLHRAGRLRGRLRPGGQGCAAAIHLWLPYTHGANYMYSYTYRGNPLWAFQDNVAAMEGLGTDARTTGGLFFGIGALVTTGLVILRMLYWWWPLHPLGYALSASWTHYRVLVSSCNCLEH
ncbi:MAG: hypothetical protein OXI24_14895, partial [Candidatus Poribacteria bacterium]|nr:hypothetical protein [Candidatus Poribacteria bacterium]